MKNALIAVVALATAVTFAAPAAAKIPSAGNPCPAPGSTFTVNDAASAALVADGFDCKNVDLVITTSITPTTSTLLLTAKTIAVTGPLTIDNNFNSDSDIFLTAEGGGIIINTATIRANDHLIIECKPALCSVNIQNSIISSPINPALTSGDTRAIAHGDVIIENSTFFGKNKVGVFSTAGKVVWHCGGGAAGCQDPLTNGVLQALCGNPPVFPCTPTFANEAALRAVCFPDPAGVDCGGGTGECQVNAHLGVDLEGSTIVCLSHFHVTSKTESINLKNADIRANDLLSFQAFKNIDATDALLTSKKAVSLETKGGTPAGVCILATNTEFVDPPDFVPANIAINTGAACTCSGPTTPPLAKCP